MFEFIARGLPCQICADRFGMTIEFGKSGDHLYLTIQHGHIDYIEHALAYGAKPLLAGRIGDALVAVGFEWIDENDPRWRAG